MQRDVQELFIMFMGGIDAAFNNRLKVQEVLQFHLRLICWCKDNIYIETFFIGIVGTL